MDRDRISLNAQGRHCSLKFAGSELRDIRLLVQKHEISPYIPMNQIGEHLSVKLAGTRLDYINFLILRREAQ